MATSHRFNGVRGWALRQPTLYGKQRHQFLNRFGVSTTENELNTVWAPIPTISSVLFLQRGNEKIVARRIEPSALPECHGSEAELRDRETCIAEGRVFNDVIPIVEYLHLPKG